MKRRSPRAGSKTYREIVPQKLNDPDGEVGYMLRFFPETIELGRQDRRGAAAPRAFGCGDARRRRRRPTGTCTRYMLPDHRASADIRTRTAPSSAPCYRQRGGKIDYARGDCPVADDLFDRGRQRSRSTSGTTARDCRNIAAAINKVLSAYCTEDPASDRWL